jgi:hypothetical protein
VLTNWRHSREMQALVTTTSVSFYFDCFIFSDSPSNCTGYMDDSTGELTQEDLSVSIPSQGLVPSSNKLFLEQDYHFTKYSSRSW